MVARFCAILSIVAALQSSIFAKPLPEAGARSLYEQAAAAIADHRPGDAIPLLQDLLAAHADSELVTIAAVHLAECYLAIGDYAKAVTWLDELSLQPRWRMAMSTEQISRCEQLQLIALRYAAAESEQRGDFLEAVKYLNQALSCTQCSELERQRLSQDRTRICIRGALEQIVQGSDANVFFESLGHDWKQPELWVQEAVLGLAEYLFHQNRFAEAAPIYSELSQHAEAPQAEQASWMILVRLRQAEILLKQKRYGETLATVARLRQQPAAEPWRDAVDFIEVRAAIALVEFDRALEVLNTIIARQKGSSVAEGDKPSITVAAADPPALGSGVNDVSRSHSTNLARAHWLSGEIHMMQRKFQQAIAHYLAAEATHVDGWVQRAKLQRAKCLELTQERSAAIQIYDELAQHPAESAEREFARKRMATLQSVSADRLNR